MEDFSIILVKSCHGRASENCDIVVVEFLDMFLIDLYIFQKMADQDLRELLTEFKNLAESEHHSFLNTLVNNFSHASTIFGALILFEVLLRLTNHTYFLNFSGSTKTFRTVATFVRLVVNNLQD